MAVGRPLANVLRTKRYNQILVDVAPLNQFLDRYPNQMNRLLHDIDRLIERSSVEGADGVPMQVRRQAFNSVAEHPNYAKALSHAFCSAVVFLEEKLFFNRSHWPQETKATILDQLQDVENVLLLSIMTSDTMLSRQFTGGGGTYDFALHPKTFKILYAAVGTWRT